MKIEWLKTNPRVCIEVDRGFEIIAGKMACQYSCQYESVVGFGLAHLLENDLAKRRALYLIMAQIVGENAWEFDNETITRTAILEIELTEMTGRRSKK